ncbi:arylsulfatase [Rapidithrix thailandica]|uniref:Arylsulfatase n=1 Tax=Rapidithrix thailandica TaxID=413964 RepID=A0AAW9S8D4_9BACT
MKKNLSIHVLTLLFVWSWLAFACTKPEKQKEVAKEQSPNIIFILADDMGVGDLGCYGQKHIQTPHIDQMAKEGMRFTQFYAGSTVCAPSRSSLMTGLHTGHAHVRGNGEYPLPEKETTFPQLLQQQGYETAMYGKWGLGLPGTTGVPQKKGWNHFMGHLHHVDAHFQRPDSMWKLNGEQLEKFATPEDSYGNELFTQEGLNFIKRQSKDKPFFLYLSYTVPHAELVVPEKYMKMYLNENNESKFEQEKAWPEGRHYGPQPYPKAAYAAMVSSLDDYVGQVIAQLKAQGLDENTMVIFSSDNGTHVEGGRTREDVAFFESSAAYKGVKRDMYEGGIHEPFVVRWPGKIKAGVESNHIAAFWDIMPTFVELAGGATPDSIDGISFVPTLLNEGAQEEHEYLYWEFHEQGGKQAVRKGNWKAIRLSVHKNPDNPLELYDLSKDEAEQNNVAEAHPEIVKEMEAIMKDARTENEIFNFTKKKS